MLDPPSATMDHVPWRRPELEATLPNDTPGVERRRVARARLKSTVGVQIHLRPIGRVRARRKSADGIPAATAAAHVGHAVPPSLLVQSVSPADAGAVAAAG